MAVCFKGAHFPAEILLTCVRWYVASSLSTRHVEELMEERGVSVDHATITRWVVKYSPPLEAAFHRCKRPSGSAGGWTKHPSASKGNGAICIALWIQAGRRSIFS